LATGGISQAQRSGGTGTGGAAVPTTGATGTGITGSTVITGDVSTGGGASGTPPGDARLSGSGSPDGATPTPGTETATDREDENEGGNWGWLGLLGLAGLAGLRKAAPTVVQEQDNR
jgi:MYXO-CTERM domain-containing protein